MALPRAVRNGRASLIAAYEAAAVNTMRKKTLVRPRLSATTNFTAPRPMRTTSAYVSSCRRPVRCSAFGSNFSAVRRVS